MQLSATYPGLRVLDLATNFAGPYAAMILGDMGADVIKVERPPTGDDTRSLPPQAGGMATVFSAVNRNKRSIMIDYRDPADREILFRLVETADVLIESFPPGFAEKRGLAFADFAGRNPALIGVSVSAFGDGPLGQTMPGYDALVQAVSGLMSFTGNKGDATVRIAPSVLDLGTGMWAAMGVMAALERRRVSGKGEHLHPALIDTAFNVMNHQLLAFLATGREPEKLGAGAPSAAPYGVYRANDGELLIATASDAQFPRLCEVLGLDALGRDPSLAGMEQRIVRREEIDRLIAARIATRSVAEWLADLEKARISCGRVNSVSEAIHLPVVEERALFTQLPDAPVVQIHLPVDEGRDSVMRPPPGLDAHRAEILAELAIGNTRGNGC
jgi:crotonobetainyl-CoA:carnitine CoA-transferase CaiB-like acyl-CoA transferase